MQTAYHLYFCGVGQTAYMVRRRSREERTLAAQVGEIRRFLDWATPHYGSTVEMASAFVAWTAVELAHQPLSLILKDTVPLAGQFYVVHVDRHDDDGRPVVTKDNAVINLSAPKKRLRSTDEWPHPNRHKGADRRDGER